MSTGRDTLKPGRGRISHFFSDMKAKFKNPSFKKDLAVYGGIASIIPLGRAFKVGAGLLSGGFLAPAGRGAGMVNFGNTGSKVGQYIKETAAKTEKMSKAFGNTSAQYAPRLPRSVQTMFEAPQQYKPFNRYFTPQAVTTGRVVAKKNKELANKIVGGFKDSSGKIVGGSVKTRKNKGGFLDPSGKTVGGSTTNRLFTRR